MVIGSVFSSLAQVQLTFPTTRAVFQRGNDGRGNIPIAGSYFQPVDQIQAKVTALQGGTSTDWVTIQSNPSNGNFLGSLNVTGGWYRLEVRGVRGGSPVGVPSSLDKVGVGEVFMIAGQSNAQGITVQDAQGNEYIPPGQIDPEDRVNVVSYTNATTYSLADPPLPGFMKLMPDSRYGLRGFGSWGWGWLGNLIAGRFNVPVLFINAAFAGTQVDAWSKSAAGLPAPNIFCQSCADPNYPPGMPYGNLKLSLQYYASMLGVRAVLWMQGETDNYPLRTSTDAYREALKSVIQQTRNDTGKPISWVVSQTSRARDTFQNQNTVSDQVTNAQLQVTQQMDNVFLGPPTDGIQVERPDGVHIYPDNGGHQQLGEAWNNSLNDSFFANSRPQLPEGLVGTAISCAGTSAYTLSVAGDNARWSNGQTGTSTTVGRGVYYGRVRVGNSIRLSQPVVVPVPTIAPQGSTEFCQGGNVRLVADLPTDNGVTWSNGGTGRQITVTSSGTYRVSFRDQAGCTLENSLGVTVNPLPDKPRIAALSDTVFCRVNLTGNSNSVTLRAPGNVRYQWTLNGSAIVGNERDLTTANSGRYTLEVFDAKNCKSPVSDPVGVRVNPNPTKPSIVAEGATTFCANESVVLTSSLSDSTNYLWSPSVVARTRSVRVNQAGQYTVRTTNRFGCVSPASDQVLVRVNPLPDKPVITASGLLSFCEEQSVTLCTSSPLRQAWVDASDSTRVLAQAPCFVAKTSGNYQVRVTDANGCKNFSSSTPVTVKPLPSQPRINQIGAFTLRADGALPGQFYAWVVNNTDTLRGSRYTSQIIKTPKDGIYAAIAKITYTNVPNIPGGQLTCSSRPSNLVTYFTDPLHKGFAVYPNPNVDGNFTLETEQDWPNATVSVYTLRGELVFEDKVSTFDERKFLRLNPVPGTYLVHVRADGFQMTKRVIIVQ